MKSLRFLPLVAKQILRQPTRSLLTVGGVAVAMFLFSFVRAMEQGVRDATEVSASDTTLIVYRENRYCPFTSRLPQYYGTRIEAVPGVKSVVPVKIHVSNCRASLDVVTFRGVEKAPFLRDFVTGFEIVAGSVEEWERRSDSALVGESLAIRRGMEVGSRFTAAGITVHVAGIIQSDEPQDQNTAYTHLAFLQEAARRGGTGGIVTQFNVKVDRPENLEAVAQAIDSEFARDSEPTSTRPEKAFVAAAAADLLGMVQFASWLGWGALAAVFALVANAIILAVQDRIRDHAIMQTVGFSGARVGGLIITEGILLGLLGGGLGATGAWLLTLRRYSLSMEGLNIEVASDPAILAVGLLLSVTLGVLAGLVPAVQASRREIASCFRAV